VAKKALKKRRVSFSPALRVTSASCVSLRILTSVDLEVSQALCSVHIIQWSYSTRAFHTPSFQQPNHDTTDSTTLSVISQGVSCVSRHGVQHRRRLE
jgi:hypothetical protein